MNLKRKKMAYNNNNSNNNTHQSIVRQSMLKAAVELGIDRGYNITEIMGVAMAFSEYAEHGTYEIAKIVEKKLAK